GHPAGGRQLAARRLPRASDRPDRHARAPRRLAAGLRRRRGRPVARGAAWLDAQGASLAALPRHLALQAPDDSRRPGVPGKPARLRAAVRRGTYSIVAHDSASGELAVAVQSHWFSVGSVVTWARPGVGAVATQSIAQAAHGP